MSILIHKNFPCVINEVCTDQWGKFVIVVFTLWSQRYIVVGLYIPPPFSPDVLYRVMEKVASFGTGKLLIMGDFNATLSSDLDRPIPPKHHNKDLLVWAQTMGLEEIWRWKYPTTRLYSCFSTSYKTASRIDLAFPILL